MFLIGENYQAKNWYILDISVSLNDCMWLLHKLRYAKFPSESKLQVSETMCTETMWQSKQLIFNQLKSLFGMALITSLIESEKTNFALVYRLFVVRIGPQ